MHFGNMKQQQKKQGRILAAIIAHLKDATCQ